MASDLMSLPKEAYLTSLVKGASPSWPLTEPILAYLSILFGVFIARAPQPRSSLSFVCLLDYLVPLLE